MWSTPLILTKFRSFTEQLVSFSCFGSLRESSPSHSAESKGTSTCKALLTTSTHLLCFVEMTACFANFQFTDLNQNGYQPISDSVSWGGQIRASVDFYWSSPLLKCHWISWGLWTKWICLRRSDSREKFWKTFWSTWRSCRSGDKLTDYTNLFYVGLLNLSKLVARGSIDAS